MRALAFCAGPAALLGIAPPVEKTALPPAAVWLTLARRAFAAGDAREALGCFGSALVHEPRLAIAHLGRALCLSELGLDEDASDAIAATLAVAAGQEEVLYSLARMCASAGETCFAMPLLEEALRAKPALAPRIRADPLFADHPAFLAVTGGL